MNQNFVDKYVSGSELQNWRAKEFLLGRELSYIEYIAVKDLDYMPAKRILVVSDEYFEMSGNAKANNCELSNIEFDIKMWLDENDKLYDDNEVKLYRDIYMDKYKGLRHYSLNDCMEIIYGCFNYKQSKCS